MVWARSYWTSSSGENYWFIRCVQEDVHHDKISANLIQMRRLQWMLTLDVWKLYNILYTYHLASLNSMRENMTTNESQNISQIYNLHNTIFYYVSYIFLSLSRSSIIIVLDNISGNGLCLIVSRLEINLNCFLLIVKLTFWLIPNNWCAWCAFKKRKLIHICSQSLKRYLTNI